MIVHIVFWRLHQTANGKSKNDMRTERRVVDYEM